MNKKLYVIGIGPGSREEMTFRAAHALEECDVIAGYKTYTDLIRADYPDKDYIVTGMTKETDRCRMALERAQDGACVALVSSGDAGVYGMAGLVYQLGTAYPDVDITVIPGITAGCSGAARLGAPLMNDFCLISLSDLMTPWETIEKRLDYAAAADFVIPQESLRDYLTPSEEDRSCRPGPPYRPAGRRNEAHDTGRIAGC